jgi:acetyltransferase EpsM
MARFGPRKNENERLCKSCGVWYKLRMDTSHTYLSLPNFPFDSTSLIIYGGGGHAKTLIDLIRSLGTYRMIGVIDDHQPPGSMVAGLPVLGTAVELPGLKERGVHLAVNAIGGIGNPAIRLKIFDVLAEAGYSCPTLIHPSAWVEKSATLDDGVQVLPQTYISSEVNIGFGTVLNAGVVVSHDCKIGRVVNLSPGALLAGNVIAEDFVQIGMGATVNLNIHIGQGARIGNGATVKADVPAGQNVHAGSTWPVYIPKGS